MRGGGPAEAKRAMPREGLCRILLVFCTVFSSAKGTCKEEPISGMDCPPAYWGCCFMIGVLLRCCRRANGEIAACKHFEDLFSD